MSIPLFCKSCGDTVGTASFPGMSSVLNDGSIDVPCSGKGKHEHPIYESRKLLFGLVKEVTKIYPETLTVSSWMEYIGPKLKFLLFLSLLLKGNDGFVVNHKWVWWSWDWPPGFIGDGIKEFL